MVSLHAIYCFPTKHEIQCHLFSIAESKNSSGFRIYLFLCHIHVDNNFVVNIDHYGNVTCIHLNDLVPHLSIAFYAITVDFN